LIFGEVSRQWRDIAFSTPRLWNCISLKCTNANMETNISLCNTWLKRSSALPLSIRFYRVPSSDAVPREVLDHYQNLLWNILPYAGRWRLLDLKDLAACSYHVLHALLPNSVPMLETLSVSHDVPPTFALHTLGWTTHVAEATPGTFRHHRWSHHRDRRRMVDIPVVAVDAHPCGAMFSA
jgi:hypothetical protein